MNKYYIHYEDDFKNTYALGYSTGKTADKWYEKNHWTRISYKEMREKAIAERKRRHDDPVFSGFADIAAYPYNELYLANGECAKHYIEWEFIEYVAIARDWK